VETVLVVSAWEPEIAPLRRRLARGSLAALGRGVICRAIGVGAVDAAAGAARAIAEVAPSQVIFVGTAGRYPTAADAGALPIGGVALPGELVLISTATMRGDAYLPAPLVQRAATAPALLAALRDAAPAHAWRGVAASPLAITQTSALARRLVRVSGAAVENLEAFSVARAAALANLPMAAALGIANLVGPNAHAEWRLHHEAASKAACAAIWHWLSVG
jgi:nucleoside phosphorylase